MLLRRLKFYILYLYFISFKPLYLTKFICSIYFLFFLYCFIHLFYTLLIKLQKYRNQQSNQLAPTWWVTWLVCRLSSTFNMAGFVWVCVFTFFLYIE